MKKETAVAAALGRAGFNTDEARLRQIVHDAITKHHGNVERAIKTATAEACGDIGLTSELMRFYVERFEGLPTGDLDGRASQNVIVNGRQTHRDGTGQKRVEARTANARPGREPSAADRKVAGDVAKVIAITVLDTFKVRDGRPIGDVRYGELDRMRGANLLEASVIKQIKGHGVADHNARVRDIIPADKLQRMIQRAAEVADAS